MAKEYWLSVWECTIGKNFDSIAIIANTAQEAIRIALKKFDWLGAEDYISKIEKVADALYIEEDAPKMRRKR